MKKKRPIDFDYFFIIKVCRLFIYLFLLRKFQLMASAPDDIFLSSNQDTNQFLV